MILLIKNILFTVLVPGTVGVYIPLLIARRADKRATVPWDASQFLALIPLALGGATYFWCLWHFAVTGRGTPAPIDPPRRVVMRGPYRYVRNPMYVGVLLVIIGWAAFFQSLEVLAYAAFVGFIVHLFVVLVEEPSLERKFGDDYRKYRKEVGRWMPRRGPVRA